MAVTITITTFFGRRHQPLQHLPSQLLSKEGENSNNLQKTRYGLLHNQISRSKHPTQLKLRTQHYKSAKQEHIKNRSHLNRSTEVDQPLVKEAPVLSEVEKSIFGRSLQTQISLVHRTTENVACYQVHTVIPFS